VAAGFVKNRDARLLLFPEFPDKWRASRLQISIARTSRHVPEPVTPAPDTLTLTRLRRQIALAVDSDGCVTWTDPATEALLGVSVGAQLAAYAPPDAADNLKQLIARAEREPVDGWTQWLMVNGTRRMLSCSAAPDGRGVAIVGTIVPDELARVLSDADGSLLQIASLQKETDRQQRELLHRHSELVRLTQDLDDSTRGVLALHSEVDEKSDSLRRITEVKSRVVANVSHEFRTPLNAIIGLSKMLLSRADGELNAEQEKQLTYILRSSESLVELVNDLLDLSKIEAGKVALRPVVFDVGDLFAALRGMFRPMHDGDVTLTFDVAPGIGPLETDEGKISQILKNLISNAMKFTERGRVQVSAVKGPNGSVTFSVTDTGIGIAIEDQARIFEEFAQVENPLQNKVKGTGLGLSLSRRLAEILGGTLTVTSSPGAGSTFTLVVPRTHPEVSEMAGLAERSARLEPGRPPILVVEDDRQTLFLYEKYLRSSGFQIVPARTVEEARDALQRIRPAAIVLDIMLEGETSWRLLSEVKTQAETRDIPVIVVTVTNREQKARALGADEFVIKPLDQKWLARKLTSLARRRGPISRILVIDDDEVARYMLSKLLADGPYEVLEAANGSDGVKLARERQPQVIFLDFVLPGMTAFDVLDELKLDATTRNIPVIIHTSRSLGDGERERLAQDAHAILPKQNLNREVALGRIREVLAKTGLAAEEEPRSA
jgi:signal transduction histidine kinase/CheY-like chemotaxis protein